MTGWVTDDGTPYIIMKLDNHDWMAVVDTGFNKDFELPESLFEHVVIKHIGSAEVVLAGGRIVEEEFYEIRLMFDGNWINAEASFVTGDTILIGTRILKQYVLTIDFPSHQLELQHSPVCS
jgi:predicted aspartyl protease